VYAHPGASLDVTREAPLSPHALIFGCPRSGTTFLVHALQPLPDTEVISGRLFPPHLAHLAATLPEGPERELIDTSFRWALDDYRNYTARSRSWVFGEWTRRHTPTSELFAAVLRRRALPAVVFKEPFLAFAPELGHRAIPDARIVIIHRDGRDCADSLQRKYQVLTDDRLRTPHTVEAPIGRFVGGLYIPWWVEPGAEDQFAAASPFVRAMWMWREMVDRCLAFAERPDIVADGQVLTVRYEDLMRDPIAVGRTVAEHIGQKLTRPVERRLRTGHTHSIGIHATRPVADVAAATELARTQLERLGYAT
jgi:hypothetical protein